MLAHVLYNGLVSFGKYHFFPDRAHTMKAKRATFNIKTDNADEVVDVLNDYFRQYGTSERGIQL